MITAPQLEKRLGEELCIILDRPVEPGENLVEAGLDSFATMQVIAFLEDTFNIEIPEDRLPIENFATARIITEWVHPMIAPAAAE